MIKGTILYPIKIYIPTDITPVPGVKPGGVGIAVDFLPDGNNEQAYRIAVSESLYNERLRSANRNGNSVELKEGEYTKLPTIL